MIILKQFSKEEFIETPQGTAVSVLSASLYSRVCTVSVSVQLYVLAASSHDCGWTV